MPAEAPKSIWEEERKKLILSWTTSWFPADPARLARLEIVLAVLLALLVAGTAVVGFLLWKVTDYKGDIEQL